MAGLRAAHPIMRSDENLRSVLVCAVLFIFHLRSGRFAASESGKGSGRPCPIGAEGHNKSPARRLGLVCSVGLRDELQLERHAHTGGEVFLRHAGALARVAHRLHDGKLRCESIVSFPRRRAAWIAMRIACR